MTFVLTQSIHWGKWDAVSHVWVMSFAEVRTWSLTLIKTRSDPISLFPKASLPAVSTMAGYQKHNITWQDVGQKKIGREIIYFTQDQDAPIK